MSGTKLHENHRVVRQINPARQIRDDRNVLIGFLHSAFELRDNEDYLSVAWCEYFEGNANSQREEATRQLRNARSDKKTTVYWTASIAEIRKAMSHHGFRALHEPVGEFTSHTALRRWPRETGLLDQLAADALAEIHISEDIG